MSDFTLTTRDRAVLAGAWANADRALDYLAQALEAAPDEAARSVLQAAAEHIGDARASLEVTLDMLRRQEEASAMYAAAVAAQRQQDAEALASRCPRCDAAAGSPCAGRPEGLTHLERADAEAVTR